MEPAHLSVNINRSFRQEAIIQIETANFGD